MSATRTGDLELEIGAVLTDRAGCFFLALRNSQFPMIHFRL
jgi:hypothetical protein